jgi:hypothetical protein
VIHIRFEILVLAGKERVELWREADWPVVPRDGEWVELYPIGETRLITVVEWRYDGSVVVNLEQFEDDSRWMVDHLKKMGGWNDDG